MEAITNIKNYIVDSYKFVVTEAWQLGSDATSEMGNLFNELVDSTSDIVVDLATADYWATSDGQLVDNKVSPEEKPEEKSDLEKVEIFAVDTFSNKDTPAIIDVGSQNKVAQNLESNF